MLQINLLPVRQLKKRAKAQQQLGMMALLFLVTLLLLAGLWIWQNGIISDLEADQARLEQEKKDIAPFLAELKTLKKKKAELQRKAAIINQLHNDSPLTVRILDEVARTLDNQRMWLTSLEQSNNTLTLAGVALDNQTIAQFMDNLTASEFVTDVALADSSLNVISGRNLKRFALNCTVAYPGSEEKNPQDAKKQ